MSQDNQLQKAVLAELAWEPSVTAAHIGVAANAGVVTLTGHVTTFAEKQAAELAARRVKGVKAVAEEIEVRLPFAFQRDDSDIAATAINRLKWDVSVPSNDLTVKVEKGWITLIGEVDWHYQREAAELDVRRLVGVTGVSNQIAIKPRVNAENISDNIVHALNRSWFFDPKTITVSEKDGEVYLSGAVHSPHDRQAAAAAAWATPGVTDVVNQIAIV